MYGGGKWFALATLLAVAAVLAAISVNARYMYDTSGCSQVFPCDPRIVLHPGAWVAVLVVGVALGPLLSRLELCCHVGE